MKKRQYQQTDTNVANTEHEDIEYLLDTDMEQLKDLNLYHAIHSTYSIQTLKFAHSFEKYFHLLYMHKHKNIRYSIYNQIQK